MADSITVRYSMALDTGPLRHAARLLALDRRVVVAKGDDGTVLVMASDPHNTLGRALEDGCRPVTRLDPDEVRDG